MCRYISHLLGTRTYLRLVDKNAVITTSLELYSLVNILVLKYYVCFCPIVTGSPDLASDRVVPTYHDVMPSDVTTNLW